MRISFLLPGLHYGGVCRWALSLAKHLRRVEVESFVSMGEGHLDAIECEASRIAPVFAMPVESGTRKLLASDQRDVMRRACQKADAVLFNAAGILSNLEDVLRNKARIVVAHVTPEWEPQAARVRRDVCYATHLAAVSKAAAECFSRPATVIESGVEVDRVVPSDGVGWGIPAVGKVALYVGRVNPHKGHHRLLDALHYLSDEWHVVFLGATGTLEELEDIQNRAREEHPGRVVLCEADGHIGPALAAAECLVVTSQAEATPLVLLEALLAKCPVVTTSFKAVTDMIAERGRIASVVPQHASPRELAAAIAASRQEDVIERAWNVAWKHYTAAAMAKRWEDYLLEVVPAWYSQATKTAPIQAVVHPPRIKWQPQPSARPKVVCLSQPLQQFGGVETWLRTLIRHTQQDIDWGVVNVTRNYRPPLATLDSLGCPYWIDDCTEALSDADLVLIWGLPQARRYLRGFGGKVGVVSHGAGTYLTARWVRALEPIADYCIGVSRQASEYYTKPATVIHNGIDTSRLEMPDERAMREAARKAFGLNDEDFAVGFVGRLSKEKNPALIARACAMLPGKYKPVFIGPDNSSGSIPDEIRKSCSRSILIAPLEAIAKVYAALDCMVITSPHEGFSLSAVEAMWCGCPVVSTPVGVLPEIEEQFGQVAIPIPVDAGADMLATAISIASRQHPRIERAREAAAQFTGERMAENWVKFIYDAVGMQETANADCAGA